MKILITGISGFVGKELLKSILKSKKNFVYYFLIRKKLKYFENIKKNNIKFICRDLKEQDLKLPNILFDTVVHLAGTTLGKKKSIEYLVKNEIYTFNLLENLKKKFKKLIYISSQYVYGNPNSLKISEKFDLDPSFSDYGCSKINTENWLNFFKEKNRFSLIILRPCGFYNGGGFITYLIDKLKKNQTVRLFNKGNIVRDYMNITDLINIINLLILKKINKKFLVINIGSGNKKNNLYLSNLLKKKLNSKSKIILLKKKTNLKNFSYSLKEKNKFLKNRFSKKFI